MALHTLHRAILPYPALSGAQCDLSFFIWQTFNPTLPLKWALYSKTRLELDINWLISNVRVAVSEWETSLVSRHWPQMMHHPTHPPPASRTEEHLEAHIFYFYICYYLDCVWVRSLSNLCLVFYWHKAVCSVLCLDCRMLQCCSLGQSPLSLSPPRAVLNVIVIVIVSSSR